MFKLTFILILFVGMLYAAKLSCDSCGDECLSACGTRRFRACCFNYLRKKRGPADDFWTSEAQDLRIPVVILNTPRNPEQWIDLLSSDNYYSIGDRPSKRLATA